MWTEKMTATFNLLQHVTFKKLLKFTHMFFQHLLAIICFYNLLDLYISSKSVSKWRNEN